MSINLASGGKGPKSLIPLQKKREEKQLVYTSVPNQQYIKTRIALEQVKRQRRKERQIIDN